MKPGDAEWTRLITASKVAAILGVSPWESPRSLWHYMRGDVERPASNEVQRRGHYLEPAILAWWCDQHGGQPILRHQTYRLGDWAAATPDAETCGVPVDEWAIIEAKSAADMDEWGQPGTDEIPAYYLTQCHWQLHVSKAARCYVPVIGPRLRFSEYVVERDDEVGALLEAKCREFYDSLDGDEPPPLDDSPATYEVLRRLHKDIDRGESVELPRDVVVPLVNNTYHSKVIEQSLRSARTIALDLMGRAQYATHNGVRIARRQPRGDDVSFVVLAKPSDLQEPAA